MWFWPHFVVLLKSDLDVQQTHLRRFEKKIQKVAKNGRQAKKLTKYLTLSLGEKVINLLKPKVAQNVAILWATSSFFKKSWSFKSGPSGENHPIWSPWSKATFWFWIEINAKNYREVAAYVSVLSKILCCKELKKWSPTEHLSRT